jgi:2-amino-4-hydroxy-6-hydroxymethyldihydropteridine diphosphokinase
VNDAYIFIGSNVEREKNYLEALHRLANLGIVRRSSSVYETAPIGTCCEYFYNGAVLLATELSAPALKRALREIERQMGRRRTVDKNAPRPIDLDLVLFNHDRRTEPNLHLPDPLIVQRPFVAQALAELDPGYVHPTDGRTLAELAHALTGSAGAARIDPAMTARAKDWSPIYVGEISHA